MTPFEYCRDFRQQKTKRPCLSFGVVFVILRLGVSVEHRHATDGQTDRHTTTANIRASQRRAGNKNIQFIFCHFLTLVTTLSFMFVSRCVEILQHMVVTDHF